MPSHKRKQSEDNTQFFKAYNPEEVIFYQAESGTTKKYRISPLEINPQSSTLKCPSHSEDSLNCLESSLLDHDNTRSHYTASQLIDDLITHKKEILDVMVDLEWDARIGSLCVCGASPVKFRCEECVAPPLLCGDCCVTAHRHNPFHWIQRWNGRFFERTTLASLGLQLYLGHNGTPCPMASMADVRTVMVTHINGIQNATIVFCVCDGHNQLFKQFLLNKLFPATSQRPKSLFSFALLKQYQKHSSESGTPAYSYFAALRRLTNDVTKDDVKDRYREFLRVIRVWEHVQSEKYAGHSHNISDFLPNAHHDTLAVLCPSCPQPGINMASDWRTDEKMYKHTLFLEVDGNFSLDERLKKKDANDISLDSGRGFFVQKDCFEKFIREVSSDIAVEASTCSGFKAGDLLRGQKKKNTVSSGVVGAACAQHSLIRPNGMVDLQKGERYCNVDYTLAHCLKDVITGAPDLRIVLSYDVGCQYQVNFPKRMQKWFPEFLPLLNNLEVVVPKMHIKAHKLDCLYSYSLDFIPGVGQTDGEGGERIWSETNQYSGSIREMSTGSRHDKLNRIISHWNWRKVQGMVDTLVTKCLLAQKKWQAREDEFQQLTTSIDSALILEWRSLPLVSTDEKGRKTYNVYRHDPSLMPTQKDIRAQISEEYNDGIIIDGSTISVTDLSTLFINGFEIVEYQAKICATLNKDNVSTSDIAHIDRMRSGLQSQIEVWLHLAKSLIPSISEDYSAMLEELSDMERHVETITLRFPSTYTRSERIKFNLTQAALIEYKLREAQAHDALQKVRLALTHKAGSIQARTEHSRGQKAATRAANLINRQTDLLRKHTDTYNRAHEALVKLGLSEFDLVLRELREEDLTLKGMYGAKSRKNKQQITKPDGKKSELSWIWMVGVPNGIENETAWSIEAQRVQWFIACAERDCWLEELEIVKEEMCRTIRFFHFFYQAWEQITNDKTLSRGYQARAFKVMEMWKSLEARARERFGKDIVDLIDSEKSL